MNSLDCLAFDFLERFINAFLYFLDICIVLFQGRKFFCMKILKVIKQLVTTDLIVELLYETLLVARTHDVEHLLCTLQAPVKHMIMDVFLVQLSSSHIFNRVLLKHSNLVMKEH